MKEPIFGIDFQHIIADTQYIISRQQTIYHHPEISKKKSGSSSHLQQPDLYQNNRVPLGYSL
jgi:hypothetical protein